MVEPGTLYDDQCRRDFTINALSIAIQHNEYGKLVDPFNGIQDLQDKVIRTPLDPSITFSDDPLRMLRAIRFAAQLNFTIHTNTWKGIVENIDRIHIISQERITEELNKIILSKHPFYGIDLLFKSGLLKIIFPELYHLHGVDTLQGNSHKDNFYHTLKVLENISLHTNNLWLRWAALLHDIAKPATKKYVENTGWTFHGHEDLGARWVPKIFKKLKLPLDEPMRYVQKLVRLHLRPIALAKNEITDSAIRRLLFEAGDDIHDLMTLCEADITSNNEYKVKKYLKNFEMVRQKLQDVEERDRVKNWQPPITGDFIMKELNMPPGKEVGIIKNIIREAILDGKIKNDFQDAYALMLLEAQKLGYHKKS